jgi:hypothetical protein
MTSNKPSQYESLISVDEKLNTKKPLFMREYSEVLDREKKLAQSLERFNEFSYFISKELIPTLKNEIGSLDDYFKATFQSQKAQAPEDFITNLSNIAYDTLALLYALNTPKFHKRITSITNNINKLFQQEFDKISFQELTSYAHTSDPQKKNPKLPHIENIASWAFAYFLKSLKNDLDKIDEYEEKLSEVGENGGIEQLFLERIYKNDLTREDFSPFLEKANNNMISKVDAFFAKERHKVDTSSFSKFSLLIETVISQNT